MIELLALPDAEETEKFIEAKAAEGKKNSMANLKQNTDVKNSCPRLEMSTPIFLRHLHTKCLFHTRLKIFSAGKTPAKHLQNTCKTPAKHLQIFDELGKRIGFVTPFRLRVWANSAGIAGKIYNIALQLFSITFSISYLTDNYWELPILPRGKKTPATPAKLAVTRFFSF